MSDVRYEADGRVARITLDRPQAGNAITAAMPGELAAAVEQADLDPAIHVIALAGAGPGFCGGYDLSAWAEHFLSAAHPEGMGEPPSPVSVAAQARNHDPDVIWDPVVDYQAMSRNVQHFMSLFSANKPVVCRVHGFCVAGGTDLALCSDLVVIAEDAKIGYPPARVWGSPTTSLWAYKLGAQRAARLLFTGDCLSGREAVEWGLAIESHPPESLEERCEALVQRIARLPVNQLVMMKLLINQSLMAQGLHTTQVLGTVFDGITRHTPEGHAFREQAATDGWRAAVRARDEPFGDYGLK